MTTPKQSTVEVREWRDGADEPGPGVQVVRGRTHRIYYRETPGFGGRWVHKQTGNWLTWYPLLRFEGYVQLVELGGAR